MFGTRKEVDEHVHKLLGKVPPGPERDIKCLAVARLYIKIQEYSKAIEYLTCYLKVKSDEVAAHRLIAQCYKELRQPDNTRALQHLQRCIQLSPRQKDVIREACQLLLDDSSLCTIDRAKYWLDLATEAGGELQDSELIFSLRLKLNQPNRSKNGAGIGGGDADNEDETLEILIHKELQSRPQDVSGRLRLLLSYVEKNRIEKAFNYAYNVELELDENDSNGGAAAGSPFSQSIEWYKGIWQVLSKYEQMKDLKKSWSYWHLTLIALDRLMYLTLDSSNALADGTSQLFRLDQYLHKFSSELDRTQNDIQRDFLQTAQAHFGGQLMLHAVSLIFKRELTGNKNKWMGTVRDALPLLLLGYQMNPFQNAQQPHWIKHCDKTQRKLIKMWRTQSSFRSAQMGRTLLGCLEQEGFQDEEQEDENHQLRQNTPLWLSSDDLLSDARQLCADKQWRRHTYQILFTHAEHKLKEQTSHLVRNARFQQPLYDWPRVSDIESYEQEALLSPPQSLSQHVYLALCTKPENLGDQQRVRFYGNLRKDIKSNQSLSYCSPDSLTQVDIDIFLYAAVLQTQRKLFIQRENYECSNVGNRSACARPQMMPYVNVIQQLATTEQSNWWQLVQSWNSHHFTNGNRSEQRAQLQVGLEAVRGINGPHMDLIILFQLGHILNSRQDRLSLQARINMLFKQGFHMLRRQSQQELEPFARYFKYPSSSSTASQKLMHSLAEKAVTYLSKKAFKENQLEEFIEEMRGLNLPLASYLQAEAYRMLGDCSRTTKSSRVRYLEQRQHCLQQTQQLLRSHPEHVLAPIIGRDLKRCQQEAAHGNQQRSPDIHNNSSTYEDAEDANNEPEFYLGASHSKANDSLNRSRIPSVDVDRMFKKLATDFCQFKEEVNDNFSQLKEEVNNNLEAMRQDVKTLTSTLDDMLKKLKISSTSGHNQDPVDPATALGLDDLFIIDDLAAQGPGHQQQSQQIQSQQPPMLPPNNHPGVAPFGPCPPGGFYNNGLPLGPANPAQAAAYSNQWMFDYYNLCNLYGPRSSNFNLPPNAPIYGGGAGGGGGSYLDVLGLHGQSPLGPPPPGPSAAATGSLNLVESTTPTARGMGGLPNPASAAGFFNPSQAAVTTFGTPVQPQSLPQPQPQPQPAAPPLQPPQIPLKANPNNPIPAVMGGLPNSVTTAGFFNPPAAQVGTFGAPQQHPAPQPQSVPQPQMISKTNPVNTIPFNRALNNQPVEKEPPANVVITSSDPLPKADALNSAGSGQLQLSVTIPAQHIKPSLAPAPAQPAAPANPLVGTSAPAIAPGAFKFNTGPSAGGNIFGGGDSTFSFKPQVAQAAADKQKEKEKEQQQQKEENPTTDRAKEDAETSFDGSAELDYDPRPDLQGIIPLPDEVEVRTGEEDEDIKFNFRAKLFRHVDKEWKERGIGSIKILRNPSTGIYRILMRRDQTHKICANHKITKDMELTQTSQDAEKKSFIWAANDFADEHLQLEKFLVRFKLPETAAQFEQAFKAAQADIKEQKQEQQLSAVVKQDMPSFATSTPANPLLSKPLELVKAKTATGVDSSTGAPTVNFVAKSLFGTTAAPPPPRTTTTTTPSPFANFSFSNISTSKPNSSPFGNLSFGTPANNTSTNNTTLFTTALIKDTTIFNANTTTSTTVGEAPAAPSEADLAEADTLEEYVPTAQFTPVIPLPELVEVVTGEENELILFEHRAKLLRYDRETTEWKERGLGNIKLLQSKSNPQQIRLVMRREQIHKLCCNQRLLAETKFDYMNNSKTALTWAAKDYAEGEMTSELLCIRFKTAETCKAFLEEITKAQKLLAEKAESEQKDEKKEEKNGGAEKEKVVKGFGDAFKPASGSWSCESCYTNNGAGQIYCLACEAPKDSSVPPKPAIGGGIGGSGSVLNLSTNSNAGKFSFGFPAGATTSPASGFVFGATTKPKEKSSPAPAAAPIAVTTSAPSALGFGKSTAPLAGFGDAFKPKAGSWTCSGCYVTNDAEVLRCKACETPKDGAADKTETSKLGSGSNISWPAASSTQFKFGCAAASAAVPAPAKEAPFGSANFSFTPKASGAISSTTNTTSVPSTTSSGGTILGSNTFNFSMPKPSAVEPKSPQADESANDNDYHVEEENNTYFAPVIPLPDKIEVKTGEEDEEQLYEHRAKLYRLSTEGEWKERGLGNVKILRHKQTHKLRVVMRREQVLKICLNHILNVDVIYKPKDEKSWMFAVNDYSEGESILERFALRFKTPEIAQGFYEAVKQALDISPEEEMKQVPKEIQSLAEKLKLDKEFLLSDKKCTGCRGCDVDSFEFASNTVNAKATDSVDKPPLPLHLPALKLPPKPQTATSTLTTSTTPSLATNQTNSIFKASSLSAAASSGFGSFGSFGQTISANSTITSTTKQPQESKPSFAFGSGKVDNPFAIVASNNQQSGESATPKSIFGQVLGKAEDGEITKSIFGGTSSNLFDGSGSSGTGGGSAGYVFGSAATTTPGLLFGNLGKDKNNKEADKQTSSGKPEANTPIFGLGKENHKEICTSNANVLPDLAAKAGDDFASLVAKGQNTNAFQKSATGGFYNLTHQNDFKNFQGAKITTDGETDKDGTVVEDDDGDATTDDNYDPYYEPIVELPDEIVVTTGEENETKLFGERTKLYRFDPDSKQWKERGVGEIKVLEHPELKTFRMVMRQEQIHKLILNMKIGSAFKIELMNEQCKSFLWANYNYAVDSEGKMSTEGVLERLACRFKKQEPADEFFKIVNSCIDRSKTMDLEAGILEENEDPLSDGAAEIETDDT